MIFKSKLRTIDAIYTFFKGYLFFNFKINYFKIFTYIPRGKCLLNQLSISSPTSDPATIFFFLPHLLSLSLKTSCPLLIFGQNKKSFTELYQSLSFLEILIPLTPFAIPGQK